MKNMEHNINDNENGLGRQVHFLDFGGVRLAKTFIRKTTNVNNHSSSSQPT